MARKEKISNALQVIRKHVAQGRYQLSHHAQIRMSQRRVNLPEVLEVLRSGWHEKRKDEFKEEHNDWNYAIRSQTRDQRDIRVCVAVEQSSGLIVVTVINLEP